MKPRKLVVAVAPTAEPAADADEIAAELEGLVDLSLDDQAAAEAALYDQDLADPARCLIDGLSSGHQVPVGDASFLITACDKNGTRRAVGGDGFFIAIRGASRVRARVVDNVRSGRLDPTYDLRLCL